MLLAAPGSNGRSLFAGDAPLLNRGDSRVRRVPFTTRRPTLSETQRIAQVLLSVYTTPPGAAQQQAGPQPAEASAHAADMDDSQRQAAQALAKREAEAAAVAAAAMAASEEEASRKRAEKRARQKAKQKEQRQAQAAAEREAAASAPQPSAEDAISQAAAQVAALASR